MSAFSVRRVSSLPGKASNERTSEPTSGQPVVVVVAVFSAAVVVGVGVGVVAVAIVVAVVEAIISYI